MAGTALRRRLNWQSGTVVDLVEETPSTKSITLELPQWQGHLAGQHIDLRLTADDGYQAQRSYSIASSPEDSQLVLTVAKVDDGECRPISSTSCGSVSATRPTASRPNASAERGHDDHLGRELDRWHAARCVRR